MEIAWNQVTQQVLYTLITMAIRMWTYIHWASQACIILKARGEENNAIQVINPIDFTVCSQWKDLGLKPFVWVLCCRVCMCSCLHACKWRLQARINKEMALVAYSQAWSTAREIILCSGISARELTVHHLDLGGSTKRLHRLEQKELLFPSVSFMEENSAPNCKARILGWLFLHVRTLLWGIQGYRAGINPCLTYRFFRKLFVEGW